jgi:hypothetical protein
MHRLKRRRKAAPREGGEAVKAGYPKSKSKVKKKGSKR